MDKLISKFQFNSYKMNYIKYETNDSFKKNEPVPIKFSLNTIVDVSENTNRGKVTLDIKIFENAIEENYPFSLELSITGLFTADSDLAKDEFSKFLEINGTAALFPFLRSSIADITKTANIGPLILPLINVYNLNLTNNTSDIKD